MIEVLERDTSQLVSIALMVLSFGGGAGAFLIRDKQGARRALPIFLSVFLGSLAVSLQGTLGYLLLFASAFVSWSAAKLIQCTRIDTQTERSPRTTAVCIALLGGTLASFAFYRLGNYTGTALTWESPVIADLLTELQTEGLLLTSFTQRLRWNDGVLSGGANSMVFGFPALVALRYVSADFWLFRLPAAIAFLGACLAFFLVTRRIFGLVAATAVLAVFGLNQLVLIYARYGTSAAGSLCALLCALLLCVRLVQTQKIVWAPLAIACLYLATLGYAPARVPVFLLTFMTPLGVILNTEFSLRRRIAASGAFTLALVPVLLFQLQSQSIDSYFAARGEQLFGMLLTKYWPDEIRSLQTVSLATQPLTPGEAIGVGIELMRQVTGPQLISLIDPLAPGLPGTASPLLQPFHGDPLFLKVITPALAPFVFLGLCGCLRSRHRWLSTTLLLWLASCCVSVLLSNRVDDHRLLFAIIPLSLWAAVGISLFVRAYRIFSLNYTTIAICAALFCLIGVITRANTMYDSSAQESPAVSAIREVAREIPTKEIILALDMSHRDAAVLRLDLWRDAAKSGTRVTWLSPHLKDALDRGTILYRPKIRSEVAEQVKRGSALVLYPASRYQQSAGLLARESVSVFSRSIGAHSFLIVDTPKEPYSSDMQRAALPEVPEPKQVSLVLPAASGIPLSSLVPLTKRYGFAEMRLNKTWRGSALTIAGVPYQSGLGIHAPTTLRYAVPAGATSFQAIVAIDDDAHVCADGSARVVLRDQSGNSLHETPVITSTSPTTVSVNVRGVSELEVEVNEAEDGRDCDHVDIADALFVIPK